MAAVCFSRWLREAAAGLSRGGRAGGGGGEARRLLLALRLARWLSAGPAASFALRPALAARLGGGSGEGEWGARVSA